MTYGSTSLILIKHTALSNNCVLILIACVASVSNRVIARKLERKQKKPLPLPRHSFFLSSCPSFLDEPREETLAMQAIILRGWGGSPLFGLTGYV